MKTLKIPKQSKERKTETKALITFLKRTKNGEYASVDKTSLPYSRINEITDLSEEEHYFYGLS